MTDPVALSTTIDVMLALGSTIESHDGWRLLRTPQAPGHLWGDAMVVDSPALLTDLPALLTRYFQAQPHRSYPSFFLFEVPEHTAWEQALSARGEQMIAMRWVALTAEQPVAESVAQPLAAGVEIRAVETDAGWAALDAFDGEDSVAEIHALQRRACEAGRARFLVAAHHGQVVGRAGVVLCGHGLARMQDVGTSETWRRRGIASHLIAAADAWAHEQGATRTVIVADADREAIGLYERIGFTATDEVFFVVSRPTPV